MVGSVGKKTKKKKHREICDSIIFFHYQLCYPNLISTQQWQRENFFLSNVHSLNLLTCSGSGREIAKLIFSLYKWSILNRFISRFMYRMLLLNTQNMKMLRNQNTC